MPRAIFAVALFVCLTLGLPCHAAQNPSAAEARAALAQATTFIRSISAEGGYLWWYAQDLKERAGETKATETQIWVQPPGTPTVGGVLLRAYEVTKDKRYLDAAQAAASALARGQLESGGWDYLIDFDPQQFAKWYHRTDKGRLAEAETAKRRNITTLDDNTSQSALRFLMAVADASPPPENAAETARLAQIRKAVEYGLQGLIEAQYPNGAWPQRHAGEVYSAGTHPSVAARIPVEWPRTHPNEKYSGAYTFNDGTIRDCILTLLEAHRRYGKPEYLEAARKGGDFIIRAQLPAPQPAWAQQYNFQMEPIWARKFEPPSISGNESVGVIRTLIEIYLATGDEKYLAPIPVAAEWFERSEIAPGKWARFYELGTNKPLYFTRDYQLVYTDDDLPTHYSFQGNFGIKSTLALYNKVRAQGREAYLESQKPQALSEKQRLEKQNALAPGVRKIIDSLDEQGRWLKNGRIETGEFVKNVGALCDYLELTPAETTPN